VLASADALTDEVKALQGKVDGLASQARELQGRIEKLPASAPDLKPLEDRVDALAKATESVAELPKRVDALENRVAAADKSLKGLRDDVAAIHGDVRKAAAPPRHEPAQREAPRPEDVNVAGEGLEEGVQLFKGRQYKEANDVFRKLTDEFPRDARVWYYAALSNGMATRQWSGETERLVNRGVEREKAGTPEADRIDAVFADLDPKTKQWLDYYRKRAH